MILRISDIFISNILIIKILSCSGIENRIVAAMYDVKDSEQKNSIFFVFSNFRGMRRIIRPEKKGTAIERIIRLL